MIASQQPSCHNQLKSLNSFSVSLLDARVDISDMLAAGDILFIDGSHLAFYGTDVPFLYLEILPKIKPGVVIHDHDVMPPYEYSLLFTERGYNEQ